MCWSKSYIPPYIAPTQVVDSMHIQRILVPVLLPHEILFALWNAGDKQVGIHAKIRIFLYRFNFVFGLQEGLHVGWKTPAVCQIYPWKLGQPFSCQLLAALLGNGGVDGSPRLKQTWHWSGTTLHFEYASFYSFTATKPFSRIHIFNLWWSFCCPPRFQKSLWPMQ